MQYTETLGHFLDANGIEDAAKKRSVFLSVIGPTTYKLLTNLCRTRQAGVIGNITSRNLVSPRNISEDILQKISVL